MSALEALIFGYRRVATAAGELALRSVLRFSDQFEVNDDDTTGSTTIAIKPSTMQTIALAQKTISTTGYVIDRTADFHITVQGSNVQTYLPANPVKLDRFEIKSLGNGNTISTGSAKTIDNLITVYALANRECVTLHYNGFFWELC